MLLRFNKPCGVLCQFRSEQGRACLADYIDVANVYPAGRLDKDSEGLLLLTDDGKLQARIAEPARKLPKHYLVQVEGEIDRAALDSLTDGVMLRDGPARAMAAIATDAPDWLWERQPPIRRRRHIPTSWAEVVLSEGRNRQVRRMTAAVGFPTLRLLRTRIGPWSLDGLQPGEFRKILGRDAWEAVGR